MNWQAFVGIALTVLIPAVLGLVGWVWALWQSHHNLKLKVAEEYPKSKVVEDMRNEIKGEFQAMRTEFREDFSRVQQVIFLVAQRLEIPVALESVRR